MRIRIDDPDLLPDLVAALSVRVDAVVSQISDHELEVGFLSSQILAYQRLDLEERLRAWRLSHPGTAVVLIAS